MSARTTHVDRRIATMLLEGAPGDIPEVTIKRHLRNKAPFHRVEEALFRADLTRADLVEELISLLRPKFSSETGVLGSVRALGGQFARARMMIVLGGETLETQRDKKIIEFRTNWHFLPGNKARLTVAPTISSQIIYLPDLVQSSLNCSFDKVEARRLSVGEIIASLPKVDGLRWIAGNTPTIIRVSVNHQKETGEHLFPEGFTDTWTTDEYESPEYGHCCLFVGTFGSRTVHVNAMSSFRWNDSVGLFVLGVPD